MDWLPCFQPGVRHHIMARGMLAQSFYVMCHKRKTVSFRSPIHCSDTCVKSQLTTEMCVCSQPVHSVTLVCVTVFMQVSLYLIALGLHNSLNSERMMAPTVCLLCKISSVTWGHLWFRQKLNSFIWLPFTSFSCLTMLNKSGKSRHPYFVHDIQRKPSALKH